MGLAQPVPRLTEKEYLALERAAEFKSEFYDGELSTEAGVSEAHSLIASNLLVALRRLLNGRPCVTFNSDLRVEVHESGLFTHPDLSVVCGERQFLDDSRDTLLNPGMIAEVLSPSTEAYDRGAKFSLYRQVASLREYLLVSQTKPVVDLFIRHSSSEWLVRSAEGLDTTLVLPEVGVTLSLREIYADVTFPSTKLRDAKPASR
jgi:Uma2 family endonuclease